MRLIMKIGLMAMVMVILAGSVSANQNGLVVELTVGLTDGVKVPKWPLGTIRVKNIPGTRIFRIWVEPAMAETVLAELDSRIEVDFVERVKKATLRLDESASLYQWEADIDRVSLLQIADGAGAVVALLDTGVDLDNPVISKRVVANTGEIPGDGIDNDGNGYIDDVAGWNFGDSDPGIMDDNGHGTAMASLLVRIAPGVGILPLKLSSFGGAGFGSGALAEAIYYAVARHADIINMSLTLAEESLAVSSAVKYAYGKGCLLVAAAGNDGGEVAYPASMDEVIAVGALYRKDEIASWLSPVGPEMEVVAPGVAVEMTSIGGVPLVSSGTSASAAMVSGALAVLVSKLPTKPLETIQNIFFNGARDLGNPGRDNTFGYGALDGFSLRTALLESYQTIGSEPGAVQKEVAIDDYYRAILNMTPDGSDIPVQEWIIIGGRLAGRDFSFFYNGAAFVDWDSAVRIPETARAVLDFSGTILNPLIPELSLKALGYGVKGENLWYCYAYSTDTNLTKDIVTLLNENAVKVTNVVTLIVK